MNPTNRRCLLLFTRLVSAVSASGWTRARRLMLSGLSLLLASLGWASNLFVPSKIPGWSTTSEYVMVCAWGDYDGDGFPDVFVPRVHTDREIGATTNLLFHNNRDGSFSARTAAEIGPVVSDVAAWICGFWIDVNSDGNLDLWVQSADWEVPYGSVTCPLYLNQGDGTFRSVSAGALTGPLSPSAYICDWADYDNDGVLDVFVPMGWDTWSTRTNALLHGRSDGTFEAVTSGPVVTDNPRNANESLWGDLDNDGDPDLLLANVATPSFYYRNDRGGNFTRITNSLLERPAYAAARHQFADVDNDGDLDVIASGSSTFIFRNDGFGGFALAQTLSGGSYDGAYCGDYDNDGDVDLLMAGGSMMNRPLTLYSNNGKGRFAVVSEAFTGVSGRWNAGPWVDVDNDGFLDLVVGDRSQGEHSMTWYRNQGNGNHWLKLHLIGRQSNRSALGTKVRVRTALGEVSQDLFRWISASPRAEDGGRLHFGLGGATRAASVRIEWPSGVVQELNEVEGDRFLTLTEEAAIQITWANVSDGLRLTWRGVPGVAYTLQSTASVATWEPVSAQTVTPDAEGRASVTVPVDAAQRFHRVLKQ